MKHTALALILLSTTANAAPDMLYREDPTTWGLYSVTRVLPQVAAPDGSKVTPFLAPSDAVGNVGPIGFSPKGITTGLYVQPNQIEEWSGFYEYLGGDRNARVCVNKIPEGTAEHQCIAFDGETGAYTEYASDDAIVRYSIASIVDRPHWFYVSMTFRTTKNLPADTQVFPYVQVRPGQRFALWRWRLTTGQAP